MDNIASSIADLERKLAGEEAALNRAKASLDAKLADAAAKNKIIQDQQASIGQANATVQQLKAVLVANPALTDIERTIRETEAKVQQQVAALNSAQQAHSAATAAVERERQDVQSRSDAVAALQQHLAVLRIPNVHASTLSRAVLPLNGELAAKDSLVSDSGHFTLAFQEDSNVVIYDNVRHTSIWATNTCGKRATKFVLQGDGNLVLYDYGCKPLWSSGTAGRCANRLVMQDDGNLVLYDNANRAVWASNTKH